MLEATIAAIRERHRNRNFHMEQRKRIVLSLLSHLRVTLGWRRDLPEAARKKIAKQAQDLVRIAEAEAAGDEPELDDPAYTDHRETIRAALASCKMHEAPEDAATKEMERLAASLPVWGAWAKDIQGFSARGLAVIVAEAGDLSNYPTKGHLWKRMGVAVIGEGRGEDDVRQGGLSKGAPKERWIEHGYSAQRRARLFVIGDGLIKASGLYREVYLQRLAEEHAKAVASGLIPATTTRRTVESWSRRNLPELELVSKIDPAKHRLAGHMAQRAQRYMEKRLLRDLWRAWRGEGT